MAIAGRNDWEAFASAVSAHPVTAHAVGEVVGEVLERLGTHPDLAVVFVTGGHAGALEDVGRAVRAVLSPSVLLGAASGSVIGPRGDVGSGPAIVLWCALVGPVVPLLLDGRSTPRPPPFATTACILLGDPTSPAPVSWPQALLRPGQGWTVPVIGGTVTRVGLLVQERVVAGAAVGALIGPSVRARLVTSDGGRPFGEALMVTRSERNIVYELDGRPALERLMDMVTDRLPASDVHLVNEGLRLAPLADAGPPPAGRDRAEAPLLPSLVVRGADRSNGAIALDGTVTPDTLVKFEVRDPRAASESFERALSADHPEAAAGALLFRSELRDPGWFDGLPADATTAAGIFPTAALAGCATSVQVGPELPGDRSPTDRASLITFEI